MALVASLGSSISPNVAPTVEFGRVKVCEVLFLISSVFLSTLASMREALLVLLFINLYVDTGARGADLLLSTLAIDSSGIKWRNCKFFLSTSESDSTKVVLAAEVSYLITKKTKRSRAFKPSLLIEMPKVPLAFDTVALLFIAAKLAGVFPSHIDWDSLHQRPPSGPPRVQDIPTNPSKANDYVFSDISEFQAEVHNGYNIQRMRAIMSDIGNALGIVDSLHLYALRRMVGNTAEKDVNVSEMERHQVMGHSVGSSIFQRHYVEKLPQLDIQQIIRNVPENRIFLEGISGYSARRVKHVQQHRVAVDSLVEEQEEVILLRSKLSSIRAKYNSMYGSKSAARRIEPQLVLEAETLEKKIDNAVSRYRSRLTKTVRHQAFQGRLRSMLEGTDLPQDDVTLSAGSNKATGIEIFENRHISDWLHQIGDRSRSVKFASWFFSRPHKLNRFYPGMACTVEGKCPIAHKISIEQGIR